MIYNKNEFHQGEPDEEFVFDEFACVEGDEAGYEERFYHEDEYNRDVYVGLAERNEFEASEAEAVDEYRSWTPGRKSILQKAMKVLKVRAITIATGAVIATSPAAEKTGLTYPGASDLLKPDGTPILPQTHHHVFDNGWTEEQKSSCTQPGIEVLVCTSCNQPVQTLPISRSNHSDPVWTVLDEGDCSRPEKKQLICPDCNEVLETETKPASGHTPGDVITDTEAGCSTDGLRHTVCEDCGETIETITVPATGHIAVTIAGYAPTCTQAGLTDGQQCADCGILLTARTIIPAAGHTEVIDRAVEATCTSTGLTEGSHCGVCGEVIIPQEVTPMIDHTWQVDPTNTAQHYCTVCGTTGNHTENVVAQAVAATCTTPGTETWIQCSECLYDISQPIEIPALGHTEVTDPAVEATCTSTGLTEGSHCGVCGEVIIPQTATETIPHTEVIDQAVAATCTATGLTEGSHCDVCSEVIIPQEVTPMIDHTWQADPDNTAQHYCTVCGTTALHTENLIAERVAATCTTPGTETWIQCSECLYDISQPIEIPALGHDIVTDRAVPATCEDTGLTEGQHCSRCDEETVEQQVIDALGHTWEPMLNADTGEADPDQHQCTVCNELAQHNMTANANGHACDDCYYAEAHTYTASADGLTHICDKCGDTGEHTLTVKYDDSGMEDYNAHICSLCNAETPHNWVATSEAHGTHQCDCGLEQTLPAAVFESDDEVHICTVCNAATEHTWTVAYMDDGSLNPDNHQCTICQHQAAHIWDPDQVSPNGHVCSCGYAGAHTFSTDAPTDTDTCDICHETWAVINGW